MMGISRSGYYKWKNRGLTKRDINRKEVIELVREVHQSHPSHGYRWTAAYIRINYKKTVSDNYVYKAYQYLGIQAETKHKEKHRKKGKKESYPNLIFSTWETVDRPRQVIVSDMTVVKFWYFYYEVTFYFDVFTKQILSWHLAERKGDRDPYIEGLKDVLSLLKGCKEPTIIHTDQGSVYSSKAYNDLIKEENIVRSMSRAGKPTDNPVNEALNGWIKEELRTDFEIENCKSKEELECKLEDYVTFYNKQRPCYALGYDTPDHYYKRYQKGELEHKDTFANRELTEVPKFVQKKKSAGEKDPGNDSRNNS